MKKKKIFANMEVKMNVKEEVPEIIQNMLKSKNQ